MEQSTSWRSERGWFSTSEDGFLPEFTKPVRSFWSSMWRKLQDFSSWALFFSTFKQRWTASPVFKLLDTFCKVFLFSLFSSPKIGNRLSYNQTDHEWVNELYLVGCFEISSTKMFLKNIESQILTQELPEKSLQNVGIKVDLVKFYKNSTNPLELLISRQKLFMSLLIKLFKLYVPSDADFM